MTYSDGEGEFGKDRREPISRLDIDAKLVVAAAHILGKGLPCAGHSRSTAAFSSRASVQPGLQSAVIRASIGF